MNRKAGLLTSDQPASLPSLFPSGFERAVPVTAAGAVADFHCIPFSIRGRITISSISYDSIVRPVYHRLLIVSTEMKYVEQQAVFVEQQAVFVE